MNWKQEPMTPKRRFLAGVLGGRMDAVPTGSPTSVATVECMEASGAYFPDVHTDGPKMAALGATAHTVLNHLEQMNKDGMTVLCSLHFLSLARRYAHRVIALKEGQVVFDGPPEEIDDARFKEIYGEDAVQVEIA